MSPTHRCCCTIVTLYKIMTYVETNLAYIRYMLVHQPESHNLNSPNL